jgi:organic hydroperoxide reductase OsmC/OhrA
MIGEPVEYEYFTSLEWTTEKKGILRSKDKPDIEVACPPEFGGHEGIWSPEDLLLASVEVCTLTTFLWFINKEKIKIKSYKSNSSGTVKMVGGTFRFSSISIKLEIELDDLSNKKRIEIIVKKIEKACLISNSINCDVNIDAQII